MTTSGTVGTTVVNITRMCETALRRTGLPSGEITAELLDIARNNLYSFLSALSNKGVNLWCIEKSILGVAPGQLYLDLPVGTVDELNTVRRSITYPADGTASSSAGGTAANAFDKDTDTACTQTSTNGNIKYDFGEDVTIVTLGVLPNATATWNLSWEYSTDDTTWTVVYAPGSATYTTAEWSWADIEIPHAAQYFRVRETGGGTLDVQELCFGRSPTDIPLSRLNRDDYTNLPSKSFQSDVTSFWLDRQRTQPRMWLWPTPNSHFVPIVVWRQRHIQDLGALTNEAEIPQRWIDAVEWELTKRMALESPRPLDANRMQLILRENDRTMQEANDEERDNSPIYFTPNIGVYTR